MDPTRTTRYSVWREVVAPIWNTFCGIPVLPLKGIIDPFGNELMYPFGGQECFIMM